MFAKNKNKINMKKIVLITGTSSGIGKATVFEFAKKGWNVIATQRNPEKETDFNSFDNVKLYNLDVTNLESITQVFNKVKVEFYINRGFLDHYSAFVYTNDTEKIKELEEHMSYQKGLHINKKLDEHWYRVSY
jgi:short-subunit dehydrogenase